MKQAEPLRYIFRKYRWCCAWLVLLHTVLTLETIAALHTHANSNGGLSRVLQAVFGTGFGSRQKPDNASDPLADWLDHLVLTLPDQSFKKGLIKLSVKEMRCTHFSLQDLESSVGHGKLANHVSAPVLSLRGHKLAGTCEGAYETTIGASGHVTVTLGVEDNNDVAIDWSLLFHSIPQTIGISLDSPADKHSTVMVPDSISTSDCNTSLRVTQLHFTGSLSAKVVDLFSHTIANSVSDAVQKQLCPRFPTLVDPLLTSYVRRGVAWLNSLVSNTRNESKETKIASAQGRKDNSVVFSSLGTAMQQLCSGDWMDDSHSTTNKSPLNRILTLFNTAVQYHLDTSPFLGTPCDPFYKGINGFLEDHLNETRLPLSKGSIESSFTVTGGAMINMTVENVSVAGRGWHEWTQLQVMSPVEEDGGDKNTSSFHSVFKTHGPIIVKADISLLVLPPNGPLLSERFFVDVELSTLQVWATLNFGLDQEALNTSKMTQLIAAALYGHVDCLLALVHRIHAIDLSAVLPIARLLIQPKVVGLSEDSVVENLEQDLDELINNVVKILLTQNAHWLTLVIGGAIRGQALTYLNEWISNWLVSKQTWGSVDDSFCKVSTEKHAYLNFTRVPALAYLNSYLNTTVSGINKFIDCNSRWLLDRIQTVSFDFFEIDVRLPSGGSNLQSLEFLRPSADGVHLDSQLVLGAQEVDLSLQLLGNSSFSNETINATLSLGQTPIRGSLLLKYDILQSFGSESLGWLAPVDALKVLSSGELGNVGAIVSFLNGGMPVSFNSSNYPEVQLTASTVFSWAMYSVSNVFNEAARRILSIVTKNHADAGKQGGSANNMDKCTILFLVLSAIFVFAQPFILLWRRTKLGVAANAMADSVDMAEPLLQPSNNQVTNSVEPVHNDSLMFSPQVPVAVRYLLPIVIFSTIFLLLSSNLNKGATVDVVLSMSSIDHRLQLPPVFSFSLYSTAKDMLSAGIYPLFFLVVVFSGLWPYAKLLLMLAAWVAPSEKLAFRRREKLLLKLDALSKFSLVDTYVFVVMLVAFRYHSELAGFSSVDVYVTPQFGFYGFLLATSFSLIIGHALVYFHRLDAAFTSQPSTSRIALWNHNFCMIDGSCRRFSDTFQVALILLWCSICALLTVGITRESFVFEIGGLAGSLPDFDGVSTYSLVTLGSSIPLSMEASAVTSARVLQVAFFFYAVFTPFATLGFLLAVLILPLSPIWQARLRTLAEIANAWSAVEVFALSIIAALFEISTFASFIVGHRCDLLDDLLVDLKEDSSCYTVHASVLGNAAFLVLAVVLNSCWVSFVLELINAAMLERGQIGVQTGRNGLDADGPTFPQRLESSHYCRWIFVSYVNDASGADDADPPIISEEVLVSFSFEEENKNEHDPDWKDWKETTNVT